MIVLDDKTLFEGLAAFMLLSVRLGAMMLAAPFYSAAAISVPVRVLLTVTLSIVMIGAVPVPQVDVLSWQGAIALAREALIGAAIGFVMQLAFAAIAVAGEQISFATGLGFAAMVDPQTGMQSPVIAQFLSVVLVLVFLALDGHHVLLRQLAASFTVLPLGGTSLDPKMWLSILQSAALVFSAGFLVALPVVVALTLINLVVGMLTRLSPQMNIFSVGFPVTIVVGLVLMVVAVPGIGQSISGLIEEAARRMREVVMTGAGA